jgi:hypothetical protein
MTKMVIASMRAPYMQKVPVADHPIKYGVDMLQTSIAIQKLRVAPLNAESVRVSALCTHVAEDIVRLYTFVWVIMQTIQRTDQSW